jgi:hypothetical protein
MTNKGAEIFCRTLLKAQQKKFAQSWLDELPVRGIQSKAGI